MAIAPRVLDAVLQLPLFGNLAPRLRTMLANEARFEVVPPGEMLTVQGQYASNFWIVLSGTVASYRDVDGKVVSLGMLEPGAWFGEINALSHQPSMATLKAQSQCSFLVVEQPLFKELYAPKTGTFRKLVDARYRERALAVHLQVAPLFKNLPEDQLHSIRDRIELVDYDKGQPIARAGTPADALYLVRSGAVQCTHDTPRGRRILGYYMANSSFGERAHLSASPANWPGDYSAMAPTSVLRVPRGCFDDLPKLRERVQQLANSLVDEEAGVVRTDAGTVVGSADDPMNATATVTRMPGDDERRRDLMVQGQAAKGGIALAINLDKCIRCNACVESCVSVHEDRVPRLSKAGPRVQAGTGDDEDARGKPPAGKAAHATQFSLASSCYNCEIPECMIACPWGAIRRDVNGLIRFEWDNCVGCQSCTEACPYEVISMTPPPPTADAPPRFVRHWFLRTLPVVGRLFADKRPATPPPTTGEKVLSALRQREVRGKAIKCDLCAGLPFEACVYNCPTQAILRIAPEDLVRGDGEGGGFSLTGARAL